MIQQRSSNGWFRQELGLSFADFEKDFAFIASSFCCFYGVLELIEGEAVKISESSTPALTSFAFPTMENFFNRLKLAIIGEKESF